MKTYLVSAALACAALTFATTAASAANDPIPGVDVVVHCSCHPGLMVHATSNASGQIELQGLAPGNYEIEIDGKSLIAAMDKLAPPAPAKKSGGSLGFSVGGMFGGGSSHSSSGHEGATNGHPDSGHGDSHSSSGGVGVGLSVPIGGDKGPDQPGYPITNINITLPTGPKISFETPYCRESAGQGMRIGFTVPENRGSITMGIGVTDEDHTATY